MTRRYYEQEMRYLHESGKAFAEAHPEAARFLNVDSLTDRDPYVERLFEGFAFLAGRIHERLDDAMPEYTEALLTLLYPHFLRPVPSLCMVELRPKVGLVQDTTVIAAGTELRSAPVGEEHVACRFTTTRSVRLQPIRLKDVQLHYGGGSASRLRLNFEVERGADFSGLELDPVRLYLHAEMSTAAALHAHLTAHVDRVVLSAGTQEPVVLHGQQWVRPAGLEDEDGILPYGSRSFSGLRLLQEYLSFRTKFWSVDLAGFDRLSLPDGETTFSVELHFDATFPETHRVETDNLRLYCVPIVNLFETDAEPLRVEGYLPEYRLTASVRHRKSVEIYDVREVVGIEDATGARHDYTPYYTPGRDDRQGRYFSERRRTGPSGRPEVFLSLSGGTLEEQAGIRPETLSVRIRATNGTLPRERLREGMINQLAPDVPPMLTPSNLSAPTLILHPPTASDPDFFWKLISHLSFNHVTMASREALLGLLQLYDWSPTEANRRRMASIRDVRWEGKEEIYRGAVMRGGEVVIEIDESGFLEEGEVRLFGLVLSKFFSLAATINSFVHLRLVLMPSGRSYAWRSERGVMPVL